MTILQVLWILAGVLLGNINFPFGLWTKEDENVKPTLVFVFALTCYTLTIYPIRYFFDR